jgi:hypothetical protein
MAHLSRDGGRALNLDYGDKTDLDQYWDSYLGEEVRRTCLSVFGFSNLF